MKALILPFFLFIATLSSYSQEFRKGINKDSLYQTIIRDLPEQAKADMERMYKDAPQKEKDAILFWFSMPTSSKAELIANIDSNLVDIKMLRRAYRILVPKEYNVYVEITPPSKIYESEETWDIKITRSGELVPLFQKWSMPVGSEDLRKALSILDWTPGVLTMIKEHLQAANCISIEDGEIITIGFARSGLGKYSFKIFPGDLTAEQIKKYNTGCQYIHYRDNIVLEYGGGAAGPQCFPK